MPGWLHALRLRGDSAPFCRAYTKNLTTLSGYLVARRHDALILRSAAVHFEGQTGAERPLQGEVRIPLSSLDFYVILGPS